MRAVRVVVVMAVMMGLGLLGTSCGPERSATQEPPEGLGGDGGPAPSDLDLDGGVGDGGADDCGACASDEQCVLGHCQCRPESDADLCARLRRQCDTLTTTDACGVTRTVACGSCVSPMTCGGGGASGVCGCTPQCAGKVCGADGCGGQCGQCPEHATCGPSQATCGCDQGYLPDPTASSCLATGSTGGAVTGLPSNGYCVGAQYWIIPDPRRGLVAFDCGPGRCQPDGDPAPSGSCTCGSPGTALPALDFDGYCVRKDAATPLADREALWFCFAGNTRYLNCRAQTAQDTGLCQTLITDFGHSTACYCDVCVRYDADSRTCRPACTGLNSKCAPAPAEGVFVCVPP